MILKRYPYRPRHEHERPDPSYGVGYRPDWPSILSVAHDTADGGALFIVTDRPCVLVPGPTALPLSVGGLAILAAGEILSVKFRVQLSDAVPAAAAWAWDAGGAGPCSLIDPLSNHAPNPASGTCADVPGPYGALVVAAVLDEGDTVCRLTFDRPVAFAGSPPYAPGGAVHVGGQLPTAVSRDDARTLNFLMPAPVPAGSPWQITAQPAWLATTVRAPQGGTVG